MRAGQLKSVSPGLYLHPHGANFLHPDFLIEMAAKALKTIPTKTSIRPRGEW